MRGENQQKTKSWNQVDSKISCGECEKERVLDNSQNSSSATGEREIQYPRCRLKEGDQFGDVGEILVML